MPTDNQHPEVIPDKQVVRLLQYLFNALCADQYLQKYLHTMDRVVSTTLAMPFVTGTNEVQTVHAQGLPYLALWRPGGRRERDRVGLSASVADLGVGWMCRTPGAGHGYAGSNWAGTWANLVWDRMCTHIEEMPEADQNVIACEDIEPVDYILVNAPEHGLTGFSGTIRITHTSPLIDEQDARALEQVALTIRLYTPLDWAADTPTSTAEDLTVEGTLT